MDNEEKRALKPITGEQRALMTGNEVVAWACLAADADIMYGYPITPQTEIMHYWTRLSPKFGREFLQTEDEISASFTAISGVMAGRRSFTATSGPGNILMQEAMCMAELLRLPIVQIVQQRGGPSTGTVIYSQQESRMCCFGGNSEGFRIVYSTSSHQELFDYTIKAFNTAWTHMFPTVVLGDGYQAKMRESVTMYDPAERGIEMVPTTPFLQKPGCPGIDRPPEHLQNTFNTEEELNEVVEGLAAEYAKVAPQVVEYSAYKCEDADYIIIGHGVVTRAAVAVVDALREKGIKAGHFRPITLQPFAGDALRAFADNAKKLFLVESAMGQLRMIVTNGIYGCATPMVDYFKPGKGIGIEELVKLVEDNL